MSGLLLTGGRGRLGTELRALLLGAVAPGRADLDVTDPASVRAALEHLRPTVVVHAAAYTDVAGAEREPDACWRVNVTGTRHVAEACATIGAVLLHVSTDYVFWGDADPERAARGGYREDDLTGPVRNRYALSKLAAEDEARGAPRHLIVRTSFRPRAWPYPNAFTDVRTSQTYVDELAPDLALVARHAERLVDAGVHVLHVVGPPTTVFELARRRAPDVVPATKAAAGVMLPDDVVLDRSLWLTWKARLEEEA
ncbi:MAG: NAD(P)-dependent oxidoreductase [Trueperaceae bacterium]|nr:NAD(P)-dependent oxidoreductase [Trueperaceae bacterium]